MISNYKIGIYLRISNEDKNKEDESNSIKSQRILVKDFIENSLELKNSTYFEYVDDGYSGTNFNRPNIKKLLDDIKINGLNCIIVKDLSRFGRNYIEVSNYLENIFPFLNVRFISINDNYDSNNSKYGLSDLDINFKNLIYDYYSKDLSKKIKSGKIEKAKKGFYQGVVAPFGYKKSKTEKGKLEIDKETAPIIETIFDLALKGKSNKEIANYLNQNKIPTKEYFLNKNGIRKNVLDENKKMIWFASQVRTIIINQVYIGNIVYSYKGEKCVCENMHKPIIEKEKFLSLQKNINYRNIEKSKDIFSNKIKCGYCRYSLLKSGKSYVCNSYKYNSNMECENNSINIKSLEETILKILNIFIENFIHIQSKKLCPKDVIKNINNELDKIDKENLIIYDLYLNEELTKESYLEKKKYLKNKKEELSVTLKEYRENTIFLNELEEKKNHLKINKLTKEIVEYFINKIYVFEDNRIDILWKFKL